jgi:hypothetical protein
VDKREAWEQYSPMQFVTSRPRMFSGEDPGVTGQLPSTQEVAKRIQERILLNKRDIARDHVLQQELLGKPQPKPKAPTVTAFEVPVDFLGDR